MLCIVCFIFFKRCFAYQPHFLSLALHLYENDGKICEAVAGAVCRQMMADRDKEAADETPRGRGYGENE